jgi:hypothetical protein
MPPRRRLVRHTKGEDESEGELEPRDDNVRLRQLDASQANISPRPKYQGEEGNITPY